MFCVFLFFVTFQDPEHSGQLGLQWAKKTVLSWEKEDKMLGDQLCHSLLVNELLVKLDDLDVNHTTRVFS